MMKLSEVIAELENGSTKTYESYYDNGIRVTMSRDGEYPNFQKFNHEGTPYDQLLRGGYFSGNCRLGLDWRPVKTSVEWNVAIGDWSLGKEIYCEIGGCRFASNSKEFVVTPRMISLGVWYVEDSMEGEIKNENSKS